MADTSVKNSRTAGSNKAAALADMYSQISDKNMFPFWATSDDVTNDEVRQLMNTKKAVPHLWTYEGDIEPLLHKSAELISMDDSERRSLVLINPGLNPKRATVSTMYTAYRLNDPNEIMPPHKHSPSAIRFGLTGKGNFTGVEGEDVVFGPGDMVLTPNDAWHNHGTMGDEQARLAAETAATFGKALAAEGYGEITTEIAPLETFYYAEPVHQQYLAKNPNGYRCHANTGVKFPQTA